MTIVVAERRPWRARVLRLCALVGAGLVAISIAMANASPFDHGDLRVLDWMLTAGILLVTGACLLLVAAVGWLVASVRRRLSPTQH